MTAQELAKQLHGCTEISNKYVEEAKKSNLVIVTGYSDDNIEFEGAIYDEVPAYEGGIAFLTRDGIITECDEACRHCAQPALIADAKRIEAHWDKDGYSWVMEALDGIKAYPFDMLEEEYDSDKKEKFCKGLVFSMGQLI